MNHSIEFELAECQRDRHEAEVRCVRAESLAGERLALLAECREALSGLLGRTKPCGCNYDCVCASDAAAALLAKLEAA